MMNTKHRNKPVYRHHHIMHSQFFPGLDHIYWCMYDNLPLIEEKCATCGKPGKMIIISPPGDIRLALKGSSELVKSLFQKEFGTSSFLDRKVIMLNKISGMDRREQIIVDSYNIATLEFDIVRLSYRLELNLEGAVLLSDITQRKTVVIDPVKFKGQHLKGKKINGEFVIEMSSDIKPGDSVIVKINGSIGVGTALESREKLDPTIPAVRIKDIMSGTKIHIQEKCPQLKDIVQANIPALKRIEQYAINEIRDVLSSCRHEKPNLPVSASFSGGKDSLVAFSLALQAVRNVELIFIDTGLEFPETVDYVNSFTKKYNLKLRRASANDTFWREFDTFGPPGKDYRWCCKICKLAPVTELISKEYPQGAITIEGNRKYESFSRASIDVKMSNPFVPNQTIINPIRNWRSLEVWLYIIWKGLEYNPLYDLDYERIGCWLCPSSLGSEFENLSNTHPNLRLKWIDQLNKWASQNSLDDRYVNSGFWRWKQLPPKMLELADKINLKVIPVQSTAQKITDTKPSFSVLSGISPCIAGGFSIEAVLKSPYNPKLETIASFMTMLGDVRVSDEFGVILVNLGKNATAKIFAGGQLVITAENKEILNSMLEKVVPQLLRAHLCTTCGICEKACPRKAITIKGAIIVDKLKCTHCLKCAESCVIVKFGKKILRNSK